MTYNLNLYVVCSGCGFETLVPRDNLDTFTCTCVMCEEHMTVMIPIELQVVIRDANAQLPRGARRDIYIEG